MRAKKKPGNSTKEKKEKTGEQRKRKGRTDSTSMSALSDSTTTTASPLVTLSPGFFSHETTYDELIREREEEEERERERERGEKERKRKKEGSRARPFSSIFERPSALSTTTTGDRGARLDRNARPLCCFLLLALFSFPWVVAQTSTSTSCAGGSRECGSHSRRERGRQIAFFPFPSAALLATGPKRAREERATTTKKKEERKSRLARSPSPRAAPLLPPSSSNQHRQNAPCPPSSWTRAPA